MPAKRTIPRLWRDAVARNTGTAYLVDQGESWREVSWGEAAERVELLANGLLARGIGKGDAVGILARTTLEWALFDFALGHVGAIGVGIYANSSPRDVQYLLEHSEAVGVLCEDDAQRAKVEQGRSELPALREVLTFGDLDALEAEGRAHRATRPAALDDAVAAVDEEDIFTFIYTSGTTGPPKGCMIRHRNYHAMVTVVDDLPDYSSADDVLLLYLPLAHNFGRLMHLSGPYVGYTTAFLPEPLEVCGGDGAVLGVVVARQCTCRADRAGGDHGGARDDHRDALAVELRVHGSTLRRADEGPMSLSSDTHLRP